MLEELQLLVRLEILVLQVENAYYSIGLEENVKRLSTTVHCTRIAQKLCTETIQTDILLLVE